MVETVSYLNSALFGGIAWLISYQHMKNGWAAILGVVGLLIAWATQFVYVMLRYRNVQPEND